MFPDIIFTRHIYLEAYKERGFWGTIKKLDKEHIKDQGQSNVQ